MTLPFRIALFALLSIIIGTTLACSHTPNPVRLPTATKAFVLVHGWQGNKNTFGDLAKYLAEDYPDTDIYVFDYWSPMFLPKVKPVHSISRFGLLLG